MVRTIACNGVIAVGLTWAGLLAGCGGGGGDGGGGGGDVLFEVPAPQPQTYCTTQNENGAHIYECFETVPLKLAGYIDPNNSIELPGFSSSSIFYDRPAGNLRTYNERSFVMADKSMLAPSGTAVYVWGLTGAYNTTSGTATERQSIGIFDAQAQTPVLRTPRDRQVTEYIPHRDGTRWIPLSRRYASAWYDQGGPGSPVAMDILHLAADFAGYQGSTPLYTARRTMCGARLETSPGGETVQSADSKVSVYEIATDGSVTALPEYIGPCPISLTAFENIATELLPNQLHLDWRTGQPR